MIKIEDLIQAYKITRSNKRRTRDSVAFELHWERDIAQLCSDIVNHTLAPTAYTFVTTEPRPREVFACNFAMRVVHHYLDLRIRPIIERKLTTRAFNNRVGYGVDAAINTLLSDIYKVSEGYTRDCWVIMADLRGFFPNADQGTIYKQLSSIIEKEYHSEDKDELHYMLLSSVFSYPTEHCERRSPLYMWKLIKKDKSLFNKPHGIGGVIGHLFWQIAMNYYLNDYDHYMVDSGFHYVRFVDDMAWVTTNKESMLAMFPLFRRMLAELGCEFNSKFYCQHYTKGGKFLSTPYKLDRVYVSKRLVRRCGRKIDYFNKRVSVRNIDRFLASMNSYFGVFKTRNGYGVLKSMVDRVNPQWWTICYYNDREKKVSVQPQFSQYNILKNKYHLKFSKNYEDKRRKAQRSLYSAA